MAGAFLVVADFIVPITVLLVAGADFDAVVLETAVDFLMTVPVLASLDSLAWLTFLLPRVDAVGGAEGTAGFLVRGTVPAVLEVVVEVVAVRDPAVAPRFPLASRTILDSKLDEDFVLRPFIGDAGRAIMDLAGEAGRSSRFLTLEGGLSLPLGPIRALVDVGDRICPGRMSDASTTAGAPRSFFVGLPSGSTEFSLSSISAALLDCGQQEYIALSLTHAFIAIP